MKRTMRSAIILLALAAMVCGIAGSAWALQSVSEGTVVAVQEWTLFIRTSTNEPLSFNPYWVQNGTAWVPARPASTVLPALESGERVSVTWTLDEHEGRRRIDSIRILSAMEGTTKGVVASTGTSQLAIRPKDEPGTVTMNPKFVQIEGRWVPDPAIASKLATLQKGAKVTVRWFWDNEGRKRISAIVLGW